MVKKKKTAVYVFSYTCCVYDIYPYIYRDIYW